MSNYSGVFQAINTAMRAGLKIKLQEMGEQAGKPIEITDDILNDIAVAFMVSVLSEHSIPESFAAAYQSAYAIQNEE